MEMTVMMRMLLRLVMIVLMLVVPIPAFMTMGMKSMRNQN